MTLEDDLQRALIGLAEGIQGNRADQSLPMIIPAGEANRPGITEVIKHLDDTELPGGLAAGPSYRTVNHLTIAWQPEWTQVVDDGLQLLVERTFMTAAELAGETGQDTSGLEEASSLASLTTAVRNIIRNATTEEIGRPPGYVQVVFIWLDQAQWEALVEQNLQEVVLVAARAAWSSGLSFELLEDALDYATSSDPPSGGGRSRGGSIWDVAKAFLPPTPGLGGVDKIIQTGETVVAAVESAFGDDPVPPNQLRPLIGSAVEALRRVQDAQGSVDGPVVSPLDELNQTIRELGERIDEPYAFDVFAEGSINFGLISTYRQIWLLLDFQVGDMVASIPLTPGEKRTYKTVRKTKETRLRKETQNSTYSLAEERSVQTRLEEELQRRAETTANFQSTVSGGLNVELVNVQGSSTFGGGTTNVVQSVKQSMREAAQKAAKEIRRERSVEVQATSEFETETSDTIEIRNPNDELTLTALFYELEERFAVTEALDCFTPVVLVPFAVPAPSEVDIDWILAHAWIIKRVLLDDMFLPMVMYVTEDYAGDITAAEVRRATYLEQQRLVRRLGDTVSGISDTRDKIRRDLQRLRELPDWQPGGEIGGFLSDLVGGPPGPDDIRAARVEAGEKALEYIAEDLTRARDELSRASDALSEATARLTEASQKVIDGLSMIAQLRVHLKQNILYYMQAIWLHEPPDQRFFRIHDINVPTGGAAVSFGGWSIPEAVPLREVADLDNLLGFKGNYAIFPMTVDHPIPAAMIDAHLTSQRNLLPEIEGTPQQKEFAELASELIYIWPTLDGKTKREERKDLAELAAAARQQILVVPTGQLVVESLPGRSPLLEDFKLAHRKLDVVKARHEADGAALENLRVASRIAKGDLGDPTTERVVYVDSDIDFPAPT